MYRSNGFHYIAYKSLLEGGTIKDGRIVAIEILYAGKRTAKNLLALIDLSIVK